MSAKDTKNAEPETVTLALVAPGVDVFDANVQGVGPITRQGTELPTSKEKELRSVAAKYNINLRKVS